MAALAIIPDLIRLCGLVIKGVDEVSTLIDKRQFDYYILRSYHAHLERLKDDQQAIQRRPDLFSPASEFPADLQDPVKDTQRRIRKMEEDMRRYLDSFQSVLLEIGNETPVHRVLIPSWRNQRHRK